MVMSARGNRANRQTIRDTWASDASNVYFVIGEPCVVHPELRADEIRCEDAGVTAAGAAAVRESEYAAFLEEEAAFLAEEQAKNGDIVAGSFIDVYAHLPAKAKVAFDFAVWNFPDVQFVHKSDDDQYLKVASLRSYLLVNKANLMPARSKLWAMGNVKTNTNIDVNPASKNRERGVDLAPYFVERLKRGDRDAKTKYPPWPKGSYGYTISAGLARYISDNSARLWEFQGEDVSVGIWIDEARVNNPKFKEVLLKEGIDSGIDLFSSMRYSSWGAGDCLGPGGAEGPSTRPVFLSVGHRLTDEEMRECHEKGKAPMFETVEETHEDLGRKTFNWFGRTMQGNKM